MQNIQKRLAHPANQFLLMWLLGGLLFRVLVAVCLAPGLDEAYYYIYSINLDWSYYDHPVFVALSTGFGPWLTGVVNQFTLRWGALLFHTGSLLLLYLTTAKLFSRKAANLTLAIATIAPIFQVGFGILTLPDNPLIFFWSASLYCAACEFFPSSPTQDDSALETLSYRPSYRLSYLGILVGLACISKYHGFVLGLGLVGFCLTSSRHRAALLSPWTGLSVLLFVIATFPLWFWNLQHDWISFGFQLDRGVPRDDYEWLDVGVVFLSQIGYLFPTIGLPLWWVSWQAVREQANLLFPQKSSTVSQDLAQKQLLILWVSLPLTVGFTLMGGYQQILPTWPIPGFWGLTVLLGYYATHWQQHSHHWVRRWLNGSALVVYTILLLALLHVTTGTLLRGSQYAILGGFWSAKDDPSTELIDIGQLRHKFAASGVLNAAMQNSDFIFTDRYYLGGQVGMALYPVFHKPITCFDPDLRGFAFWSQADHWLGKNALYITPSRFHKDDDPKERYQPYFNQIQEIGTVPLQRGGTVVEVMYVYQAETLLKPYPRPYGN